MNKCVKTLSAPLLIAATALGTTCNAKDLPLWEVGAGVAGVALPYYRGSDKTASYVLPVPYFVYRGEYLKADRNGVRTRLFDNDRVEVNLSANATLPVYSKDNEARRGMPDLKPTVELGGNLSVSLWNSDDRRVRLDFRAPLRTAITVQTSPKQIGWVFAPNLNVDVAGSGRFQGWNLGMQAGPLFQNREYNAYFYSVSADQATPGRPAYDAPGGYSGSQFTMALSRRFRHYWVGSFLRYDSLAGAAFEDSPLVRSRSAVSAGFAVAWIFGESSRHVEASE